MAIRLTIRLKPEPDYFGFLYGEVLDEEHCEAIAVINILPPYRHPFEIEGRDEEKWSVILTPTSERIDERINETRVINADGLGEAQRAAEKRILEYMK